MFGFQWHLTDRCNRRCRHCYQKEFVSGKNELNAQGRHQLADAILGAIPHEPVTINLTGGEPLLLPDLLSLAAYLETFDNLSEFSLITNGAVTDTGLIGAFAGFTKFSQFKMSIESGEQRINDQIRGSGALEALAKSISLYRELTGKPVVLMMTLSRVNAATIAQTASFARASGAQGLIFERFVPLGSGLGMSDAVLQADDWYQAVLDIGKAAGLDVDPDELAPCRAFWLWLDRDPEDALDAALCNLGSESMALMPDGTVFPCRRLEIALGNLLCEPFAVIRARLAEWESSQIRPRLRGDLCGQCYYTECPGCRALARALTGDPLLDDSQCVLNSSKNS